MLLFLTSVLVLSSLTMVVLLYAKHWELVTGSMLMPGIRPRIAASSSRLLMAVEHQVPTALKNALRTVGHWLRTKMRLLLLRLLISIERSLEALLETLRHSLSPMRTDGGEASSAFLREVAEEKRKLTRVSRRRAPIQDIEHPQS